MGHKGFIYLLLFMNVPLTESREQTNIIMILPGFINLVGFK
jgi:hypothetical protein